MFETQNNQRKFAFFQEFTFEIREMQGTHLQINSRNLQYFKIKRLLKVHLSLLNNAISYFNIIFKYIVIYQIKFI